MKKIKLLLAAMAAMVSLGINAQTDFTSKVETSQSAWGGSGTYNKSVTTSDNRTAILAEFYGSSDAGVKLQQTINNLEKGMYEVTVFATSHNAWSNYGASLSTDADDVAYIFATSNNVTLKEFFTARKDGGMAEYEPFKVTISDIAVPKGSLTIGLALAKSGQTEWQTIQIYQLTRTGDIDLSNLVDTYKTTLANAKAVNQDAKMAPSVLTVLQNALSTYDEGKVDENDADALEAATDALNAAITAAQTSITSYSIIAAGTIPDNSLDGWVCENNNTFHINTWSTEGDSDGSEMKTPFIENWVSKGSYLGAGKVYYKLEGLEPNEVYYAQALVRSYNEANNDAPNGPNFFINDVVTSLSEVGTTFVHNNMSGIYATLGGAATVGADGTLTLGVEIAENRNYNWVAFKSVSIRPMADAFNAAVAKVTALENTIPEAAYQAAYAVVTSNSGENYPTTAAGFETAIAAIEAAATTASALIDPYTAWNAAKASAEASYASVEFVTATKESCATAVEEATTASAIIEQTEKLTAVMSYVDLYNYADALVAAANDNSEANRTLATAISNAATSVGEATTVEGITTATSTLKTAMVTYVAAANPTGDAKFDLTFMLTNPDLTYCKGWAPAEGWYTDQTFNAQNSQVMNDNQDVANTEDPTKFAMYEYWSDSSNATSGYTVYLKVTLPEGTYKMDALAVAGWGWNASSPNGARNITFSAGDVDGTQITTATLEPATLDFIQATEGEVKIGLKAHPGNQSNWMGIGYVKLYKVATKAVTVDEDVAYTPESMAGTATLKRTFANNVDTWNTFVVPFQITNEELKVAFGNNVNVAEYSDEGESSDAVTVNFTTMETPAIQANQPVLIKGITASNNNEYVFTNRTVAAGNVLKEGTYFNFVGTYAPSTNIAADNYFIKDNKLYKSIGNTTIKGTRAYLTPKFSGIKAFLFIDGVATRISDINGMGAENGTIYNIAGQRVNNAQKGIFIINGKKVVK
jgi:hypothetical protein